MNKKKSGCCVKFGFKCHVYMTYIILYITLLSIDTPGPPTRLEPSDITKDAVTLTWCEPDDDGGSPITGYWVERLDPDTDKWVRCNKMPIKDTTFR